jgi:hypothetical protein
LSRSEDPVPSGVRSHTSAGREQAIRHHQPRSWPGSSSPFGRWYQGIANGQLKLLLHQIDLTRKSKKIPAIATSPPRKFGRAKSPIRLATCPFEASAPSRPALSHDSASGTEADDDHHCKDASKLLGHFLQMMGTWKPVESVYLFPCPLVYVATARLTTSRPWRASDWQLLPEWEAAPSASDELDHPARTWLTV